ncbi:MAG: hypothetical protein AAF290_07995 [Pseudomonadota bacterium]
MLESPGYLLLYLPIIGFLIWQFLSVRRSLREEDDEDGRRE